MYPVENPTRIPINWGKNRFGNKINFLLGFISSTNKIGLSTVLCHIKKVYKKSWKLGSIFCIQNLQNLGFWSKIFGTLVFSIQ